MINILEKIFIKDQDEKQTRQAYGMLCGIVGILLNVLLFAGKFLAGTISHSIAITADAFNNLSDAGSSFVTLIGFQLAGAKPDPDHPFGHGRIEYVSGLVVSGAILIMAFELVRDSIDKIRHPQETNCSLLIIVILVVSILVKFYMSFYNRAVGKKIASAAMMATATDSLSDACATTVVLIATLVAKFTGLQIDGYCGVLVGLFIFYAGINAAKETLDPLLGQPPEQEFVDEIERLVLSHEPICGMHDLIVHDYGPGRVMVSLHAEVPADGDLLEMHDVIDNTEAQMHRELGCDVVIHMDPVVTNDPKVDTLKAQEREILAEIDDSLSLHDFRVVTGPTHTNVIFDVVLPFRYKMEDAELIALLRKKTREKLGENYFLIVKIDKAYS